MDGQNGEEEGFSWLRAPLREAKRPPSKLMVKPMAVSEHPAYDVRQPSLRRRHFSHVIRRMPYQNAQARNGYCRQDAERRPLTLVVSIKGSICCR